jgi:hypothetical protein
VLFRETDDFAAVRRDLDEAMQIARRETGEAAGGENRYSRRRPEVEELEQALRS